MRYFNSIRTLFLLSLLLLTPLLGIARTGVGCEKIRAAIDVGSGTTKMSIARVNTCNQSIIEAFKPEDEKAFEEEVRYENNTVIENGNKVFTDEIVQTGIEALKNLKKKAESEYRIDQFSAVATSAFRKVQESNPGYMEGLLAKIKEETQILVRVLSHEQEAQIGFYGALSSSHYKKENLLVWDIGGGSMQITWWDEKKKRVATPYLGKFANEDMLDSMLEKKPGTMSSNPSDSKRSPNPVGIELASKSVETAQKEAQNSTPKDLKEFISTEQPTVVGIGGVHFYSNCEIVKRFSDTGCTFTYGELRHVMDVTANMSDDELVEQNHSDSLDYAPMRVVGVTLTLGFMKHLGIEEVRSLKVNMSDGILVNPSFWE